jgi:hypothetical protein
MNSLTKQALISFVREVSHASCRCTMRERDSGHRVDCEAEALQEAAEKLVHALMTDETEMTVS